MMGKSMAMSLERNDSAEHIKQAIDKHLRKKSRHLEMSKEDVLRKYLEEDLFQKYEAGEASYGELVEIARRLK